MSTDGNKRRWIYVTPLMYNHRNETKGNDVSGHTGNKRTVMKVSNATIPITTLSTVHHTNNLYKNFNHNNRNNSINDGDNVIENIISKRLTFNTRQNVEKIDNRKLDVGKLSNIRLMKKATIHKNFKQSNNNSTNNSNDEFRNIGEYAVDVRSSRRHGYNTIDKNVFANDVHTNKNRLPPFVKNDFVKNIFNSNNLPIATQQSSAHIPSSPFHRHHLQSNKFPHNEHYRLIEDRHRNYYTIRSNPFSSGEYGFWDGQHKSLDPVLLQLMFTHESILPQPHFWGIRGYGLYSFAAGNDLHNNLPNGGYKVERDFDN